jgi:hypothetical protein
MATVYLALDKNCATDEKMQKDLLGGTERFFLLLQRYLEINGLEVYRNFNEEKTRLYDICIHSNRFNPDVTAHYHILWGGSWHMTIDAPVDVVMVNSQYMKDRLGLKNALVVPAPFDNELRKFRTDQFFPGTIITTSNPNRHLVHTTNIAQILESRGVEFSWQMTGGNKLYSDQFMEYFQIPTNKKNLQYLGIVSRSLLIDLLRTSQVYVYANLTDDSETECVSCLEAAALGLSIILPKRRPFTDILPDAVFCSTEDEFANAIEIALTEKSRKIYSLSNYEERNVFGKILREIDNLFFENTIEGSIFDR